MTDVVRRRWLFKFSAVLVAIALCVFLVASSLPSAPSKDIEPNAINVVEASSVAIISYFPAPPEKAAQIIQRLKAKQGDGFSTRQIIVPAQDNKGGTYVAYIGAGTLLRDNYVL